jgi:hypothetical protein
VAGNSAKFVTGEEFGAANRWATGGVLETSVLPKNNNHDLGNEWESQLRCVRIRLESRNKATR